MLGLNSVICIGSFFLLSIQNSLMAVSLKMRFCFGVFLKYMSVK